MSDSNVFGNIASTLTGSTGEPNVDSSQYRVHSVEMGTVYKVVEPTVTDTKTETVTKKTKRVKTEGGSKVDQAKRLYDESEDKSRGVIVALFVEKLGMSKAGASTYFYNIKKG